MKRVIAAVESCFRYLLATLYVIAANGIRLIRYPTLNKYSPFEIHPVLITPAHPGKHSFPFLGPAFYSAMGGREGGSEESELPSVLYL
jgi:hypothetical protein